MGIIKTAQRTRAQQSTNAIERMYITMRHLFNRGFYKPMGVSGETLREALLTLSPEIYGSIAEDKVELKGLLYVFDRLPQGIEECAYINLTSNEGYQHSHFKPIIPKKRRRNCYRIDQYQMNIEVTRGRSEIYDILTHLTFLMIESHKIMKRVLIDEGRRVTRDWKVIEKAAEKKELSQKEREVTITHTANILGRTFEEVLDIYPSFAVVGDPDHFLRIIYHLGRLAKDEITDEQKRIITFSQVLRERLGQHLHGDKWAQEIKTHLDKKELLERPLHIISANLHSVMNVLYAGQALPQIAKKSGRMALYERLSDSGSGDLRSKVEKVAHKSGMDLLKDKSGTNIDVQIVNAAQLDYQQYDFLGLDHDDRPKEEQPVIIVMDYAFGEQAYETMDELLKPYRKQDGSEVYLDVRSVNIMGKAGILEGNKGDVMVPEAHVFEGTADNYPFKNSIDKKRLKSEGLNVVKGCMVTVLGTSLQNKDLLEFFYDSTWRVIGLEMEGAHYQKAIQAAAKVRRSISKKVKVRYAYYASDNPLKTGSTLASGGLGLTGVRPVYVITETILGQVLA